MIKTVIFDLDDTLYSQKDFIDQGFKAVAQKIVHDFHLAKGRSREIFQHLQRFYNMGQRTRIFNLVLEKMIKNVSRDKLNDYVEKELLLFYRLTPRRLKLFKEAKLLLRELKRRHLLLGLVTQGHPINQLNKLMALDMVLFFDAVEISGHYSKNKGKPSTFLFTRILQRLHCQPQEALYVGDHFQLDYGAVKAGMHFLCLDPSFRKSKRSIKGITVLNRLQEVLEFLR